MYERFSDRSRTVMQLANQEAQRFNHEYIGSEHILLGIVSEGMGKAALVLRNLGVGLLRVRAEVEKIVQAAPDMPAESRKPKTPRAKRVIEFAIEESRNLRHGHVGTEHLLLGLLRESEGVAAQVLINLGLSLPAVREEVIRVVGGGAVDAPIMHLPPAAHVEFSEKPLRDAKFPAMYQSFTDRARKVMQLANQEALRFRHEYIGTEHVLLGLTGEGIGVAANILKNLDIDLVRIRGEIEKIVAPGPEVVDQRQLPQTLRVKKVIEYAIEESRNLNHNYVGTEHLLLGLLRENEGVAAQVLMNLGLRLSEVQDEVRRLLGQNIATSSVEPLTPPDNLIDAPPNIVRAISALDELDRVLCEMKEAAVAYQDFERAANLRDRADNLRKLRAWLLENKHREPTGPSEPPQP